MTDPFTLEIINQHLRAISDEMFIVKGKASQSPIIYDVLDYAAALTDHHAHLIAQANGVTGFLGALTFAAQDVLSKFGAGLCEGDIYITNIPYEGGGSHISDISMVMPIMLLGEVVGFAVNKAHWSEVGGMEPGSMSNRAESVYQEGLQFPCIRLYEQGQAVQSLVDLIAANVRTPRETLADIHAQVAALRIGAKRVVALLHKYGIQAYHDAVSQLHQQGRMRALQALRHIPHGDYYAEDEIAPEDTGLGSAKACVKVSVSDGVFTADFTGTSASVQSSINCTRVALTAAMRIVFMALVAPREPANEGLFTPLQVVCPSGTLFTAERPAPTSTYWESRLVASDLVWRALAPVMPERLSAGHYRSVCSEVLTTRHPSTGELALMVEPNVGGWGASIDADGVDGLFSMGNGETFVLSSEVAEHRFEVLVRRYGYDIVTGGEGRHRGGRGVRRELEITGDRATLTASFGRSAGGAWGVDGGHQGTPNYVRVHYRDGSSTPPSGKPSQLPLQRGDIVQLVTGTGGGWGDPRMRDRELVARDLRAGLITPDIARNIYGYDPDLAENEV